MNTTKNGMLIVVKKDTVITVRTNTEFTKRAMKNNHKMGEYLYVHIHNSGAVHAYVENDVYREILLSLDDRNCILDEVKDFR